MQRKASIQKTIIPTKQKRKLNWFILDATGKTLGRLASEISKILRGKHKPLFTSNFDFRFCAAAEPPPDNPT